MIKTKISSPFLLTLFLLAGARAFCAAPSNGLAPEVPGLNLKDHLYALEAKLPDLEQPYITDAPQDKNDGFPVGKLGVDGGNPAQIAKYAAELAAPAKDEQAGNVDSLLICYSGKLVF